MKKILLICIMIVSVMFISGCTNEGNTETSMSSQNTPESNIQLTDSILKSSDISGYDSISNTLYSVPKNTLYVPSEYIPGRFDHFSGAKNYKDTLLMGHRNVGEVIGGSTQSGKKLFISVVKFDSDPDSFLRVWVNPMKEVYEPYSADELEAAGIYISDPNIGDYSHSQSGINPETEIQQTLIRFIHGNTFVFVDVIDEKDTSKKTAIRIAKIIDSRLD